MCDDIRDLLNQFRIKLPQNPQYRTYCFAENPLAYCGTAFFIRDTTVQAYRPRVSW